LLVGSPSSPLLGFDVLEGDADEAVDGESEGGADAAEEAAPAAPAGN